MANKTLQTARKDKTTSFIYKFSTSKKEKTDDKEVRDRFL